MSKHFPGAGHANPRYTEEDIRQGNPISIEIGVDDSYNDVVAFVPHIQGEPERSWRLRAALVEAAPDLLEAAKQAIEDTSARSTYAEDCWCPMV